MSVVSAVELGTVDYYGQEVRAVRAILENGKWNLVFIDKKGNVVSQFIH